MNPELIKVGAAVAGELVGAIVEAIASGDDIEPIVSSLPPRAQKNLRRVLGKKETLDALAEVRKQVLGDKA